MSTSKKRKSEYRKMKAALEWRVLVVRAEA